MEDSVSTILTLQWESRSPLCSRVWLWWSDEVRILKVTMGCFFVVVFGFSQGSECKWLPYKPITVHSSCLPLILTEEVTPLR